MEHLRYDDQPGKPFSGLPTVEHPFAVEVKIFGDAANWTGNGISFETVEDARKWGNDLLMRWFAAEAFRVVDKITGKIYE